MASVRAGEPAPIRRPAKPFSPRPGNPTRRSALPMSDRGEGRKTAFKEGLSLLSALYRVAADIPQRPG